MKTLPALTLALLDLLFLAAPARGEPDWHHPLYLGGGGLWRQRVRVTVRNDTEREVRGEVVALRVGKAAGEADLVNARAESVRICDALGTEMLYLLTGPGGANLSRGPIPEGSALALPVESPPGRAVDYFVYFDNPSAWPVPDFLEAAGGLRNGGLEHGEGEAPAGWSHDPNDESHHTAWVAERPRSGKRCLKTVVAPGAGPTWIATRQRGLAIVGGARYVMTAWVRAEDVRGNAGWYIHIGNGDDSMLVSPMLLGGGGTYDWKQVRAEFTAPAEATTADLGTVLRGTGTAWFDDVELTCQEESPLRTTASRPERLEIRELGADAPWKAFDSGAGADRAYRVPLRVVNMGDSAPGRALNSVDVSSTLARFQGRPGEDGLALSTGGQRIPFYRLQDVLLFEGEAPPHTARTYHLNFTARDRSATPPAPGATTDRGRRPAADYAALLASEHNLARNASFEDGERLPTAWSGAADGERPGGVVMVPEDSGLFGKRCVKMRVGADTPRTWTGWRQDVPVRPGKTYLFAAWLKTEGVEPNVQLHAHYRNARGGLCESRQFAGAGPAISGTHDWTMISGLFEMPPDIATFQLHLTMSASGTVWHDGVVLVEVSRGEVGQLESRSRKTLEGLTAWPVNAVVKVFREDLPPRDAPVARVSCARNEKEPLQLALRSPEPLEKLTVVLDPPLGPAGFRLSDLDVGIVGYVPVDHKTSYYQSNSPAWHRKYPRSAGTCDGWPGFWPDPLLPRDTLDLAAHATQPVWVTVSVPATAPAGDYRGAVRLERDGKTLKEVPFTVHVWDFALPVASHLKAIYDCRQGSQWRVPGKTREETTRQMWRFMAEHRVCPDTFRFGPRLRYEDGEVSADFSEFDRAAEFYFDELGLPHAYTPWQFYLFGWGHLPASKFGEKPYEGEYPYQGVDRSKLRPEFKKAYQACLAAFWSHVKERGWDRKIVLYISDEPHDSDPRIRAQMKALCDMIHEVDPAIRIYSSTWHHQPEWDGYLDVWGLGHYGTVPEDRIRELRAAGATVWWTTDGQMCTDTPYSAIERLLPHYCFKYGAEAYEFWGIDWLTYDPHEFGWHRYLIHNFGPDRPPVYVRYPNGDGFLAYPGGPVGHDGPVSSIRLEQVREGMEDHEYLWLLRERLAGARAKGQGTRQASAALQTASELVSMPSAGGRYSTQILPDPDAVFEVKEAVARAIELLGR